MDTIKIARAFAYLFGHKTAKRDKVYDSDIIDDLQNSDMAKIVKRMAIELSKRSRRIEFEPPDSNPGGTRVRMQVAIDELTRLEKSLRKSPSDAVSNQSLLSALGASIWALSAMLDTCERKSNQIDECRQVLQPRKH